MPNKKILQSTIFALILLGVVIVGSFLFNYDFLLNRNHIFHIHVNDLLISLNNNNCTALYPVNKISGITNEMVCPRGDVGNFMVIDKVEYKLQEITGTKYAAKRNLFVDVCITARGVAAWNEGYYEGCTNDSRIIEFSLKRLKWEISSSGFTDISTLISTTASKPENFDARRNECITFEQPKAVNNCIPNKSSDIMYAIKHHAQVEHGRAH